MIKYWLWFSVLFFTQIQLYATKIDSISTRIEQTEESVDKVDLMLELSKAYFNTNLEKAINVARQAQKLSLKLNYSEGLAYSYKNEGIAHYFKGDYLQASELWLLSLEVFVSIDDKVGIANMLSNIGAIYYNQGDYNNALDYYLKSLKVSEEIQDTLRILTALTNIGAVYTDNPLNHDQALDYCMRALSLSEAIQENNAIATVSINMGEIYFARQEHDAALKYFNRSLEVMEGSDGVVFTMVSISKIYLNEKDYQKALAILNEALEIADSLNAKPNIVNALTAKAEVYRLLKSNERAITLFKKSAVLAKEIEAIKDLQKAYMGLSNVYYNIQKFDSAYKYQELMMFAKDSLFTSETQKILKNQMFNFQIEKKQNEINLLKKDQELKDLDLKRQKVIKNLIMAGFFSVIIFLVVVVFQKNRISKEKERSEELLLNILPYEIAEELKEQGKSDARNYNEVTVIFTDFKEFTGLSQMMSAKDLVREVNFYFKSFDEIVSKYNIEKIKTIGDAYMAASGLPVADTHSVKNTILAALEMQEVVLSRQKDSPNSNAKYFNMRVGVHTGPVVAGIVGVKKFQYDIWGDTVNTASRMESHGDVGKVNISEYTYQSIKNHTEFEFENRGEIEVKGKGIMKMYFVRRA